MAGTVVGNVEIGYMLFGLVFCAVSLAIVWGTTLERIRFGAYVIYAAVFGAVIYPLIAHAVWSGDGLLDDIGGKEVLDFAGSSVVHLTGATGALAALLLLGARAGKYGADGRPRAIPGHSMPLVGLGVAILWVGWYGFNAGSTLGTTDVAFAEVALNTQLAAAAGVIGALLVVYAKTRSLDVGMAGNGAIAGLVAITAPCGYVEQWAAPIIGLIAGVLVVYSVLLIERWLDDPVGALSAHGMAGIWGTLAVGVFGTERLVGDTASPGLWARSSGMRHWAPRWASSACRRSGSRRRSSSCSGSRWSPSMRSSRRSAFVSPRTRSWPGSTSPRTGCTAIRSSSSRRRSTRARRASRTSPALRWRLRQRSPRSAPTGRPRPEEVI